MELGQQSSVTDSYPSLDRPRQPGMMIGSVELWDQWSYSGVHPLVTYVVLTMSFNYFLSHCLVLLM